MAAYESSISIEAAPEAVWPVLVDAASWPTWDSGVISVEGTVAAGSKVKIVSSANPKRAFPVTVTELDPPRAMTFTGGMPLGLFKGVRTYRLTAEGEGSTRFEMREAYSGPLSGMITRSIPDLQPSFEQFARGLKARVEGAA